MDNFTLIEVKMPSDDRPVGPAAGSQWISHWPVGPAAGCERVNRLTSISSPPSQSPHPYLFMYFFSSRLFRLGLG